MARNKKTTDSGDYDVGFGKPPRHTRFQPGQSGNPQGRPKGARNAATVLQAVLNERVTITENGKRKSITKLEAAMKQVVNRAASGESGAMKILTRLLSVLNSHPEGGNAPPAFSNDADRQLIAQARHRMEQSAALAVPDAPDHSPNPEEST